VTGPVESEVKLRFDGPDAARRALAALGAVRVRDRHFEDNAIFDDKRGSLMARGCALRLRRTEARAVVTFKGPRLEATPGVKSRPEIETDVSHPDAFEAILTGLGYRKVFRYQKYREVYTWQDAEIVLDETPLGTFVEVEGPVESIHRAAQGLGRSPADYIGESYAALFAASGGRGDMVF
jgi:adenylate cyclase class 2